MGADEIIRGLRKLTASQRAKVLQELLLLRKKSVSKVGPSSIINLSGKGAKAFKNIDVDKHLKKLRSEWD